MDSSKMSLKEGFDFLFEAKKQTKIKLVFESQEEVTKKNAILYALSFDIFEAVINNLDKTKLQLAKVGFNQRQEMGLNSADQKLYAGTGINLNYALDPARSDLTRATKFTQKMNSDDEVADAANTSAVKAYIQKVEEAYKILVDLGATKLQLESVKPSFTIKIKKAPYDQLVSQILGGRLANFLSKSDGVITYKVDVLHQKLSQVMDNLVKTTVNRTKSGEASKSSQDAVDRRQEKARDIERTAVKFKAWVDSLRKGKDKFYKIRPLTQRKLQNLKNKHGKDSPEYKSYVKKVNDNFEQKVYGSVPNKRKMLDAIAQNKFDFIVYILAATQFRRSTSEKSKGTDREYSSQIKDEAFIKLIEMLYSKTVSDEVMQQILTQVNNFKQSGKEVATKDIYKTKEYKAIKKLLESEEATPTGVLPGETQEEEQKQQAQETGAIIEPETSQTQEVLPSKDSADTQDIDISGMIEAFDKLIEDLSKETTKAIKTADIYLEATNNNEWDSSLLHALTSLVTRTLTLNISLDDFGKSLEKLVEHINKFGTFEEKDSILGLSDSFNRVVVEFNQGKNRILDYLKRLEGNDIEDINIDSSEINQDYTTMFNLDPFVANTLKDLGAEIEDSVNKSEVEDELKDLVPQGLNVSVDGDRLSPDAGPNTINREIGDTIRDERPAGLDAPEVEAASEEEVDASEIFQIKTVLSEPIDENDFVQKFGVMLSFLYERNTLSRNKLITSLSGQKTIRELKHILTKASDEINQENISSSRSVDEAIGTSIQKFNASLQNLNKYGESNIDGIIFEKTEIQKYKIKINASQFANQVKTFIKEIKQNNMQADVFGYASGFELKFKYERINAESGNKEATEIRDVLDTLSSKSTNFTRKSMGEYTITNSEYPDNTIKATLQDSKTVEFILTDSNGQLDEPTSKETLDVSLLVGLIMKELNDKESAEGVEKDAETLRIKASNETVKDLVDEGIDEDTATKVVEELTQVKPTQSKEVDTVKSIEELLEDKVIKRISSVLYKEGGQLITAISTQTSTIDFAKMRAGDEQATINFISSLALQLEPSIDVLKPVIRDIFKGELQPVFDTLFLGRKNFNEEQFKAAYSQLILSSFDKLIDVKQGRITEGLRDLMKKASRAVKSGLANAAAMAPILIPVLAACALIVNTTAFPWIMGGLGAWNIFSSIRDVNKFNKEKEAYRKNPIKYIEDSIFKDKKARKSISEMVSHLTADVVASRINPQYNIKRQQSGIGIIAGNSDWSKKLDAQLEEYNKLSDSDKKLAKQFNDRMIDQIKQTRYAKLGVISDGIVNEVFNEVMFGTNKISPEVRQKLFNGEIVNEEEPLRQLSESLHMAIANSSVKNNFTRFIEERVRKASKSFSKDSQRFAIELRDDELDRNTKGRWGDVDKFEEWRKPFRGIQRNQQLFIKPEQITEDFIGKLLVEITGMDQKEYRAMLAKEPTQFNESYIGGSLASLLFEDAASEEEKANQDKLEDERRKSNKQRNLTMPAAAGFVGLNWVGSLYQTFYVDQLISGSKSIFKSGFKVGTKKVTSVKVTDSFCETPFDANALNQMGFDPGHALIQGVDKYSGNLEKLYFYYYDGAEGVDKLSAIRIKADGSCLELGHGDYLYDYFAKNAAWAKSFGVSVDAKTGTVSAISGGKSLAASSVEMKTAMLNMKTHLFGSYKAQVTAAQMKTNTLMLDNEIANVADLLDNQGHVTPDTFVDIYEALYKSYSQMIAATGDVPQYTPSEQMQLILDQINAKINSASKVNPEMWDAIKRAMENFVNDPEIKEAFDKLHKAEAFYRDNLSADYDVGSVSDSTQSAKQSLLAAQDNVESALSKGFKVHAGEISSSDMELFSKQIILKATGSTAQAGFNPILDVDVASVNKVVSTIKAILPIEIGNTANLEAIATIALKSNAAVIAASKVLGPIGLLFKVCSKFYRRGIKGGKFAEDFYEVFKPQQLVYSDMLYAICGAEVPGRSKISGGMQSSLASLESPISEVPTVKVTDTGGLSTSGSESTLEAGVKEGYVYKYSLSNYLFENRLITKSKKVSKIKNKKLLDEINEHKNLQDMFKNMF